MFPSKFFLVYWFIVHVDAYAASPLVFQTIGWKLWDSGGPMHVKMPCGIRVDVTIAFFFRGCFVILFSFAHPLSAPLSPILPPPSPHRPPCETSYKKDAI